MCILTFKNGKNIFLRLINARNNKNIEEEEEEEELLCALTSIIMC